MLEGRSKLPMARSSRPCRKKSYGRARHSLMVKACPKHQSIPAACAARSELPLTDFRQVRP